jgi:hypothetical protein
MGNEQITATVKRAAVWTIPQPGRVCRMRTLSPAHFDKARSDRHAADAAPPLSALSSPVTTTTGQTA